MGHNKRLFTALFVLFVAVISSVAGAFALANPSNIQTRAKDGESATLDLRFYLNGGNGNVQNISHTWSGSNKSDASTQIGNLTIPNNNTLEFRWTATRWIWIEYREGARGIYLNAFEGTPPPGQTFQRWRNHSIPSLCIYSDLPF